MMSSNVREWKAGLALGAKEKGSFGPLESIKY